ncbi:MAG: hypothetical protein RL755_30 [Pseudomonadota bacterium]|jgi:hypothetical protein
MSYYTPYGFGDSIPQILADKRPQCSHCLEHFNPASNESIDNYCSSKCWYLDNIGCYKKHIIKLAMFKKAPVIIASMTAGGFFDDITPFSKQRWINAINRIYG